MRQQVSADAFLPVKEVSLSRRFAIVRDRTTWNVAHKGGRAVARFTRIAHARAFLDALEADRALSDRVNRHGNRYRWHTPNPARFSDSVRALADSVRALAASVRD